MSSSGILLADKPEDEKRYNRQAIFRAKIAAARKFPSWRIAYQWCISW